MQNYQILKATDASLLKAFNELENPIFYSAAGRMDGDDVKPLSKVGLFAITRASGKRGTCTVQFFRNIKVSNIEQASARYDRLEVGFGSNNSGPQEELISALKILTKHLSFSEADKATADGNAESVMGTFTTSFSQVGETLNSQIEELNEYRKSLLNDLDEREKAREEKAAEERAAREAEHGVKVAALEEEKAALNRQSHMHERRELRKEIVDNLKEALEFDPAAASKSDGWMTRLKNRAASQTVAIIFISLLVASIGLTSLISALAVAPGSSASEGAIYLLRIGFSTLLIAGSALVAVNWLKRGQIVQDERRNMLERQLFDINRASWVIETSLEVQKDAKGDIPPAWIGGVTNNLFEMPDSRNGPDDERVAVLSGLLGMSSKMKFGPDGAEVEIGKSGIKGAKKAADAAS